MAGNYMDAPGFRIAYDRDGSVGVAVTAAGVPTQVSQSALQNINSESEADVVVSSTANRVAIVFPIPVDMKAVFLSLSAASPTVSIETSKDTTTGVDGTWSTQVPAANHLKDVRPLYRLQSSLSAFSGGALSQDVRGVRVTAASGTLPSIRALHLYGNPAPTATPDRLALWHPTLDQLLSPESFDWGDVSRSSSADRSFRVKNLSSSLTATGIEVYVESLTPGSPSVNGMHTLSSNGGATFLTDATISTLAPGAVSSVLILRRVVPASAQISVWSARVAADVTSWI